MSVNKHIAVAAGALLLLSTSLALAKGLQGVGAGLSNPTPPSSHGVGSNTLPEPPGWANAQDTAKGWGESAVPPGFKPRQRNVWILSVTARFYNEDDHDRNNEGGMARHCARG
jgi:hypothetical protein